jgi:hypothetical protein
METLNQLVSGNFNVAVPLSYVLTAVGVVLGLYWTVRKVIAITLGFFGFLAKTNFVMVASAVLFVTGLTGGGWSLGTFASGPREQTNPYLLTNYDLKSLAWQAKEADKQVTIKEIMDYAKTRDKLIMERGQYQIIQNNSQEGLPEIDNRFPSSLLFGSGGLVVCAIVMFLRKVCV